jgi:hypothetical protein
MKTSYILPGSQPGVQKNWTVLGHIDATSNLEYYELERLERLERTPGNNATFLIDVRRTAGSEQDERAYIRGLRGTKYVPTIMFGLAGVGALAAGAAVVASMPLLALPALPVIGYGLIAGLLTRKSAKKAAEDLPKRQAQYQYAQSQAARFPKWNGTRTYHITPSNQPGLHSFITKETPQTEAPSGRELGETWARRLLRYPSGKTAFLIGGHARAGVSAAGIRWKELGEATAIAHAATGERLDAGILDGCLAANFESLLPMAPHVRYVIASQETLYTDVINWRRVFSEAQLGQSANYLAAVAMRYAQQNAQNQTLSVLRMSQMQGLRDALENMSQTISARLDSGADRGEVVRAFEQATPLRTDDATKDKKDNLIDLGSLLDNLSRSSDPYIREHALYTRQQYGKVVQWHISNKKFADETGMSIQGPHKKLDVATYIADNGLAQYGRLLGRVRHEMRPWPSKIYHSVFGG